MAELIDALEANCASVLAYADELSTAAASLGEHPGAAVFQTLARHQRILALKLAAQLASLRAAYAERFPSDG